MLLFLELFKYSMIKGIFNDFYIDFNAFDGNV